jgi:putative ABC transport system permease protein
VIALPHDPKASAILRGRYVSAGDDSSSLSGQITVPSDVVAELLANIFRIKSVLDAVILVVGLTTAMALVLVFALSLRLRQREIQTMFKLGCSRMTTARLLGAEILIILAASGVLTLVLLVVVERFDEALVRTLFIR